MSARTRRKNQHRNRDLPRADYSSIAAYYDKARPAPSDFWISAIVRAGKMEPGSRVLDVGSGTGRFTIRIARKSGAHVFALENSPAMLDKALNRDSVRRIHWVLGDARSLPFRRESFDTVYMTMVLHHIGSPEIVLTELQRLLRPGGRCVVLTTSHSAIRSHTLRHFPGVITRDLRRFSSIPSLKRAMIRAGLENVRSYFLKHDEGEVSVRTYCEMVRKKYISTLSLLSDAEFERGFKIFRRRIRDLCGKKLRRVLRLTVVAGEKPRARPG